MSYECEKYCKLRQGHQKHVKLHYGGTAVSCVLMPNVYHRYHSPVKGEVIESKDVNGAYFGMEEISITI